MHHKPFQFSIKKVFIFDWILICVIKKPFATVRERENVCWESSARRREKKKITLCIPKIVVGLCCCCKSWFNGCIHVDSVYNKCYSWDFEQTERERERLTVQRVYLCVQNHKKYNKFFSILIIQIIKSKKKFWFSCHSI